MSWFDGIMYAGAFEETFDKIKKDYPIVITDDLRMSEDRRKIIIIDRFSEDDPLRELSDPRVGNLNGNKFYHVFVGDGAAKAWAAVAEFLSSGYGFDCEDIRLIRAEPEIIYEYDNGIICADRICEQMSLKELLPESLKERYDVFVLPMKKYRYPCPVCSKRTLQWRGTFEICDECGWEDDGTTDENEKTTPNGDYTIRTYREKYLKLKRDDPNYSWYI